MGLKSSAWDQMRGEHKNKKGLKSLVDTHSVLKCVEL